MRKYHLSDLKNLYNVHKIKDKTLYNIQHSNYIVHVCFIKCPSRNANAHDFSQLVHNHKDPQLNITDKTVTKLK